MAPRGPARIPRAGPRFPFDVARRSRACRTPDLVAAIPAAPPLRPRADGRSVARRRPRAGHARPRLGKAPPLAERQRTCAPGCSRSCTTSTSTSSRVARREAGQRLARRRYATAVLPGSSPVRRATSSTASSCSSYLRRWAGCRRSSAKCCCWQWSRNCATRRSPRAGDPGRHRDVPAVARAREAAPAFADTAPATCREVIRLHPMR